jgi:hypothetical protein
MAVGSERKHAHRPWLQLNPAARSSGRLPHVAAWPLTFRWGGAACTLYQEPTPAAGVALELYEDPAGGMAAVKGELPHVVESEPSA